MCPGHACSRLRIRTRRVTRRANDDDTLISRGGRGSFFKGQPGRERELLNVSEGKVAEKRTANSAEGNKNSRTGNDDDDNDDEDEAEEEE